MTTSSDNRSTEYFENTEHELAISFPNHSIEVQDACEALRADPGILLRVIRSGKHTQASLARELGVRNIGMWVDRGVPDRWLAPMAAALGMTERRLCRVLQEVQ